MSLCPIWPTTFLPREKAPANKGYSATNQALTVINQSTYLTTISTAPLSASFLEHSISNSQDSYSCCGGVAHSFFDVVVSLTQGYLSAIAGRFPILGLGALIRVILIRNLLVIYHITNKHPKTPCPLTPITA
jgi:hypothetical protein